jgi:flagellar motor component MotA
MKGILALVGIASLLVLAMMGSGVSPAALYNAPAIVMVFLGTFFYLVICYGWGDVAMIFKRSYGGIPVEHLKRGLVVCQTGSASALSFGVMGFFVGIILVLGQPLDAAALARAGTLSLLTVFYAIFLSEAFFGAIRAGMAKALNEPTCDQVMRETVKSLSLVLVGLIVFGAIFAGSILMK